MGDEVWCELGGLYNGDFQANICVVFGPNLIDWAEMPGTRQSESLRKRQRGA